MIATTETLPVEVPVLHRMVEDGLAKVAHLEQEVSLLREQLALLKAGRFGPRSEAIPPDQYRLFNEAEDLAEQAPAEEDEPETTEVKGHTRKKAGRKPLPADLPRRDVIHDLSDDEKFCPHDGHPLHCIGEDVSEQLDIIPRQVVVVRHIRKKYGCACCEQGIKTAPLPPQPIPKSLASPGTLAFVTTSKFVDGLPLYRIEKILDRIGVDLSRATLAQWVIRSGLMIQILINLLQDQLLEGPLIHIDETTLQVLKEPGRPATGKSYIWVRRGGPPDHPILLFDYHPSRSGEVPLRLLDGFTGILVTDGYAVYTNVAKVYDLTHAGCWTHARRKYDEALKAMGGKTKAKDGKAMQGLSYIRKLYAVERSAQGLSPEERHALRQEKSRPVIEEMRAWLDRSVLQVPPKSALGKALAYTLNHWEPLTRFLEDGRIPLDNNPAENAIRPFVVGRKAWLFSDSVAGAEASANLYSLVETAKANGLEPYRYLRHVFTHLPAARSVEEFEALLPTRVDADEINAIPL